MYERVVYITPHSTVKARELIFDRITSICPDNDYSSVLYLCPNQFSVKETQRDFLSFLKRMSRPLAFIPFRASTLYHLTLSLQKNRVITDDMRILILCDMLYDRNTGYPAQLSGLLRKVKHYTPDMELSRFIEKAKGLIFEEKVLKRLDGAIVHLNKYSDMIKKIGMVDYEESLKDIADIPFYKTIVIEGFYDPTPSELSVIKRVIENSGNIYISAEEDSGILNFLCSYGIGFEKLPVEDDCKREWAVCVSYPSMEEEVEGIAKRVKALILQGVNPFNIVITFPNLSKYLPMLRRIFKRYGIPIDVSEIVISDTAPLLALDDMFKSIENDYPRNEFLSFLTSPYLPEIGKVIKEYVVKYSYMAEVIGGRNEWLSIKDIIMATSNDKFDKDEIERIDMLQNELANIINLLDGLRNRKCLSDFIDSLEGVLERFGFFNYLKEWDKEIYTEVMDVFFDLRRFGVFYKDASFLDTPWFYLRQFLKNRVIYDDDISGVRILQYESSACVRSEIIFFGGLTDEDFPSRPPVDPYLPETVKRELGMPNLEYYIDRQRRYFKRLLNLSTKEPYLSYPSNEGDRVFLPSPFLNWDMIIGDEDMNVFSYEDVLIYEGRIRGYDFDSVVLWDGNLKDEKSISILRKRLDEFTNRFINVTDLDLLRRCPLRFYIEKILCLEPIEPIRFEIDAKLWGNLAHKTMEKLIRSNQIDMNAILDCLEWALKESSITGFWADVAREIFGFLLPTIQSIETDLRNDGFMPYRLEEGITGEVEGLRLKGKIDRVDIKSGIKQQTKDHRDGEGIILLDYKTGRIDDDSLQLPLYAYMWQEKYNDPVMKMGFYSLRDGEIRWFPKKDGVDEFIRKAIERVKKLTEAMRNGDFSSKPSKKSDCGFCYHKPLCEIAD